jgi:hypothetical protein
MHLKGVKKKHFWNDKMSLRAIITMKRETVYVKSDLCMDWLVNHFIPQKPTGKFWIVMWHT